MPRLNPHDDPVDVVNEHGLAAGEYVLQNHSTEQLKILRQAAQPNRNDEAFRVPTSGLWYFTVEVGTKVWVWVTSRAGGYIVGAA